MPVGGSLGTPIFVFAPRLLLSSSFLRLPVFSLFAVPSSSVPERRTSEGEKHRIALFGTDRGKLTSMSFHLIMTWMRKKTCYLS